MYVCMYMRLWFGCTTQPRPRFDGLSVVFIEPWAVLGKKSGAWSCHVQTCEALSVNADSIIESLIHSTPVNVGATCEVLIPIALLNSFAS